MSSGASSGISNGTSGSQGSLEQMNSEAAAVKNEQRLANTVSLPKDASQLDHIFGNREGHLSDTPGNRKMLTDLANDKSKFIGKDKYGNSWNAEIPSDGSQNWVRYQGGTINEGGRNSTPRSWNDETGYNNNPVKRRKKK